MKTRNRASKSQELEKILFKAKAVTLSPKKPYKFTSGILSPVYSDLRLLISYPKERKRIVNLLKQLILKKYKIDVVSGTATAGIPWAAWLAAALNLPMVYVRGKAKEHGKKKQVEGLLKKGQCVLIVEDLISTGKSSLESAIAIKKEGGRVVAVLTVFDYTLPLAKTNFKKAKVKLESLISFPDVVSAAIKTGQMNERDRNLVLAWVKDPSKWGSRYSK